MVRCYTPAMHTLKFDHEDMHVQDEELMSDTEHPHTRPPGTQAPPPFSHRYSVNAPELPQLCEGEVVAQKYYVDRVVGRDGLAIVAHVRHVELGRPYVFKYLPPEHCVYPEVVARFLRGARAAQGLTSEHTARMVDAGRLESGAPYAVSEFMSGAPLREVLGVRGALSVTDAVDYVLQALESIAEAHASRLFHKNLSLSKLFLLQRPDGSPFIKVSDYGVADAVRTDPLAIESVRDSLGLSYQTGPYSDSLAAAAPEQVRNSRDIDGRVDIWALGCILHELLSGVPLYQADSAPGLLAMIVADPPMPLRALRSDVPVGLESLVLHCLEKDPSSRYPSLSELAAALKPFALPEARQAADRVIRTLGRNYRQPSLHGAMVHIGPASTPARPATVPPAALPQLPPPPARIEHAPARLLPLALGLGGLAIGALIALLAVKLATPVALPAAPPETDAAQLSLQREIVREIAALRAAREEGVSEAAPPEKPERTRPAELPTKARRQPSENASSTPRAAKEKVAQPSEPHGAPEAEPANTQQPAGQPLRSASADLFDKIH